MGYDALPKFQHAQGLTRISTTFYDGSVDCASLGVYTKFNLDHLYRSFEATRSRLSDIVEIKDAPDTDPGFYFCDSFGFKQVPFEPVKRRAIQDHQGGAARTG